MGQLNNDPGRVVGDHMSAWGWRTIHVLGGSPIDIQLWMRQATDQGADDSSFGQYQYRDEVGFYHLHLWWKYVDRIPGRRYAKPIPQPAEL